MDIRPLPPQGGAKGLYTPRRQKPLAGSRSYRHDELRAYRDAPNSELGLFP